MKLSFEEHGSTLLVRTGAPRLDALAAPSFRHQVEERLAGHGGVVVDLSSVAFVDSSGLAALIALIRRVPPGGSVRLAGVRESVKQLLALTRLDKVFTLAPTAEDALRA